MHTSKLRYIGNALLLIGYYIMLWDDQKVGLIIKCIGGLFSMPFAIKYKLWDVLVIGGFFSAIEISKIIHLISIHQ
jgi:hypothetical protein